MITVATFGNNSCGCRYHFRRFSQSVLLPFNPLYLDLTEFGLSFLARYLIWEVLILVKCYQAQDSLSKTYVVWLWLCSLQDFNSTDYILWVYCGYIVGILWVYFGYTVGILWVYCGYTVSILWVDCGYTVGSKWLIPRMDSEYPHKAHIPQLLIKL